MDGCVGWWMDRLASCVVAIIADSAYMRKSDGGGGGGSASDNVLVYF